LGVSVKVDRIRAGLASSTPIVVRGIVHYILWLRGMVSDTIASYPKGVAYGGISIGRIAK